MLLCRIFIVLLLLCQFGWFILDGLEPLSDSYRHKERWAAFTNWATLKTPESKAVFDQERYLLNRHRQGRNTLILIGFIIVDGIVFYYFWDYGRKRTAA